MSAKVVTVSPYDSIRSAHSLMKEYDIRHVLVTDGGDLKGILSDRDVMRVADLDSRGVLETPNLTVDQVMSPAPTTITQETTVEEMCRLMTEMHIDCLPIVDGEKLQGIVTSYDLMKLLGSLDAKERVGDLKTGVFG